MVLTAMAFLIAVVCPPSSLPQSISFTRQLLQSSVGSFGCGVADYDLDGWDDIVVTGWSGCNLFHNTGQGTFDEVSQDAGIRVTGRYVVGIWGDLNNDGLPDLFLGARDSIGSNKIFLNTGNGQFIDATLTTGINPLASVGSAVFGDYNNDGKLDLFVATNDRSQDILYENVSTGDSVKFRDVSDSAGIGGSPYTSGMQATWIDYDHEGNPDLFCVHDGYVLNNLYRNPGSFPFHDVAQSANLASYGFANSMGVSWGDYNNDGWEDVYVTNIGRGGLYRNNGGRTFSDVTLESGADSNGMSWGVVWSDFDNDGDEDLYISDLYHFDGVKSFLYENRNGTFRNIAAAANAALTSDSYGAATGDFDNDGYEDIVVTNTGNPPGGNILLFNNRSVAGHWAKVVLHGTIVNRMAIGTKVRVVAGGISQIRTVDGGSSYCSQMSPTLHFGLGSATAIDTLQIFWRREDIQQLHGLSVDTTYSITEDPAPTIVAVESPLPGRTRLLHNYPNPFNPVTAVSFDLGQSSSVQLKVYDLMGRSVATLLDEEKHPGKYTVTWDGSSSSSGIYLVKMVAVSSRDGRRYDETRKLLLVK